MTDGCPNAKAAVTRRRWSPAEDRLVTNLWGETTLLGLALRVGRTQNAVYQRAQAIGLPLGFPDGCESLTSAARRTGMVLKSLRRILGRAGVEIRQTMSRPLGRRRTRPWQFVDAFEVDEAVKAFLGTESIKAAAERRGIGRKALTTRLRVTGGLPAGLGKSGRAWRIPTEVIDRAIGRAA